MTQAPLEPLQKKPVDRKKAPGNRPGVSRAKTCESKKKFPTREAAVGAMIGMKKRKGMTAQTHVYACRFCGGWHWGHRRGTAGDRAGDLIRKIEAAVRRDEKNRRKNDCEARSAS